MIKNGKYFLSPKKESGDFKELFNRLAAVGAGRPVDEEGFPLGPWTPDLLAEAITRINPSGSGIDLRTVQLWFQDNNKGVSADNIRWLARVFGCDDPEATIEWQAKLTASQKRLVAKRKENRRVRRPEMDNPAQVAQFIEESSGRPRQPDQNVIAPRQRFSLARKFETLYGSQSTLNLPALVWAGCVTLGILAYIMDVHSVTYTPQRGVNKQVGFFWAPNWTVLELVILPVFLVNLVGLLAFWKEERPSLVRLARGKLDEDESWARRVESFSFSHWSVLFICFFIVFLVQWSGVHLRALMSGDEGNLMLDWNLIAIVRPEVISVPEAIVLSMLAFQYTAAICFLFLTGLVFLYTVAQDFHEICRGLVSPPSDAYQNKICDVGMKLLRGLSRCTVLGIWIATCIKLQATYLLSDGENIVRWLVNDALSAIGIRNKESGWLEQRALAYFTSFLLMFSTCSVFIFGFLQIFRVLERISPAGTAGPSAEVRSVPWWTMLGVVILLAANFLLIGQFTGFSIVLVVSILITFCSLYDPMFIRRPMTQTTSQKS